MTHLVKSVISIMIMHICLARTMMSLPLSSHFAISMSNLFFSIRNSWCWCCIRILSSSGSCWMNSRIRPRSVISSYVTSSWSVRMLAGRGFKASVKTAISHVSFHFTAGTLTPLVLSLGYFLRMFGCHSDEPHMLAWSQCGQCSRCITECSTYSCSGFRSHSIHPHTQHQSRIQVLLASAKDKRPVNSESQWPPQLDFSPTLPLLYLNISRSLHKVSYPVH